jgi:type I restriction enzyme S subunit
MAGEWREVTIGDLVWLHDQQITPASAPAELFYHYSIPAYDSGQRPALETGSAIGSNKFVVPRGAVLVSKLNPRLPRVWAPDIPDKARAVASTEFLVLRPRDDVDRRFLKYLMLSPAVRSAMEARVTGTSGSHQRVPPSDLLSISVEIPVDLQEQRAIAHILGTLDDKIELNRRMSQTLEAMARALFKAWFVDFEPVRAKMEGRWQRGQSLPGLPAHLYDLFPTRLVDSELGEIPEGWRVGTIGDCCIQIQNGGTPSRKEPRFWEGGTIPWLTSAEVKQPIIVDTENSITEAGLEASSAKWVAPLSTVVALYGATAGQVSLVALRLTTNQAVCALVPKQYCEFFNYLWMRSATPDLENQAVGSAQQNISQGVVARTRVLIPSHAVMVAFDKTVRPVFFRWISNLHESRTLAALRDALLPKLIRGEIRVKDAERFLKRRGLG